MHGAKFIYIIWSFATNFNGNRIKAQSAIKKCSVKNIKILCDVASVQELDFYWKALSEDLTVRMERVGVTFRLI